LPSTTSASSTLTKKEKKEKKDKEIEIKKKETEKKFSIELKEGNSYKITTKIKKRKIIVGKIKKFNPKSIAFEKFPTLNYKCITNIELLTI